MKLRHGNRQRERDRGGGYYAERPRPDEAPEPQPGHEEPLLGEPGPRDLSKRDLRVPET